eukprot:m.853264 g.853264  ORF g.853264 m.853264 type:complete len:80 (+) comp59609_c0_seq7:109-348(+)
MYRGLPPDSHGKHAAFDSTPPSRSLEGQSDILVVIASILGDVRAVDVLWRKVACGLLERMTDTCTTLQTARAQCVLQVR